MRKNLPKGKEEIVTRFLKIVTDAYVPPTSTGVVGGSAYCLSSDRLYLSGLTEEDVDFVLQYLFARSGLKVETVRTGDGQFFIPIPPESFSLIKREYLRLNPPTKPTVFISEESGILLNRRSKIPNYPITGKRGRLIQHLIKNKKALPGPILSKALLQNAQSLSRSISEINEAFAAMSGYRDDLIVRVPTGGYKLNRERFKFQKMD